MGYEAELLTRHIRLSKEEFEWARWRPEYCRPPLPAVGDQVLFRPEAWAFPLRAIVLAVDNNRPPNPVEWAHPRDPPFDPNVWRVVTDNAKPVRDPLGRMQLERHPDAWPDLLLKVEKMVSHTVTREARLRGSAGWLPLDWQQWPRPVPGLPFPSHAGDPR